MNREINNITTTDARSICISILRIDVKGKQDVELRTLARTYLRKVKQTPAECLQNSVKTYQKKHLHN